MISSSNNAYSSSNSLYTSADQRGVNAYSSFSAPPVSSNSTGQYDSFTAQQQSSAADDIGPPSNISSSSNYSAYSTNAYASSSHTQAPPRSGGSAAPQYSAFSTVGKPAVADGLGSQSSGANAAYYSESAAVQNQPTAADVFGQHAETDAVTADDQTASTDQLGPPQSDLQQLHQQNAEVQQYHQQQQQQRLEVTDASAVFSSEPFSVAAAEPEDDMFSMPVSALTPNTWTSYVSYICSYVNASHSPTEQSDSYASARSRSKLLFTQRRCSSGNAFYTVGMLIY